ncbi:phosphoribosylglycinamide formyltransferase [bacterium]|nr:phosphoribosylglycinamide formyltransferase [bacterium]
MKKKQNIIIFVSGNGSNMSQIISHFEENEHISVSHVFSNKKGCLGVKNAEKAGVESIVFSKKELENDDFTAFLTKLSPDLIVLAGFLLKVPDSITKAFENKIINVHPALLPKFGGKGMYGKHVHEAVIEAKEKKSGITFHYVNENYDEGNIIKQYECEVSKTDTVSDLQKKIQKLEHNNFCSVIENLLIN